MAAGTFVAAGIAGKLGIAVVMLGCVLYPASGFGFGGESLSFRQRLLVITATMFAVNIDALGDLLGVKEIRFSWLLIALASVALVLNRKATCRLPPTPTLAVGTLLAYLALSGVSSNDPLRAFEINASYGIAFLTVFTVGVLEATRRGFAWKLSLALALIGGYLAYEIAFPHSDVSISSTRISGETGRGAALYANANDCGFMLACMLCYVATACNSELGAVSRQNALLCLGALGGAGVTMTFSRSAALAYVLSLVCVANTVGRGKLSRIMIAVLIAFGGALGLSTVAVYVLKDHIRLAHDAALRLDAIKDVFTGKSMDAIARTLESRRKVAFTGERYWRRPSMLGQGFGFVQDRLRVAPHNMPILMLIEGGVVGTMLFVWMMVSLYLRPGGYLGVDWRATAINTGILVVLLTSSHSLMVRRFFVLAIVNVLLAVHTVTARRGPWRRPTRGANAGPREPCPSASQC